MKMQRFKFVMLFVALGAAYAQVPYQKIAGADSNPGTWVTYSGNYQAQRFSQLDQINKQNVSQLKPDSSASVRWSSSSASAASPASSPARASGVIARDACGTCRITGDDAAPAVTSKIKPGPGSTRR